jgi:hypothetical protein
LDNAYIIRLPDYFPCFKPPPDNVRQTAKPGFEIRGFFIVLVRCCSASEKISREKAGGENKNERNSNAKEKREGLIIYGPPFTGECGIDWYQ